MMKWFILTVLLLPVAEIATFVVVALAIGWGWAVLLMLATTAAGFVVLKQAGRGRLTDFGAAVTRRGAPTGIEANTGTFLGVLAGILLFLPGFVTDLAGLLLLLPPVRRAVASRFVASIRVMSGRNERTVVDLAPDQWRQEPDGGREPDRLDRR